MTSVVGIVFTFLLLIVFHFSIALSGMQKKQSQIAQRCAILEAQVLELASDLAVSEGPCRRWRGRISETPAGESLQASRSHHKTPADLRASSQFVEVARSGLHWL